MSERLSKRAKKWWARRFFEGTRCPRTGEKYGIVMDDKTCSECGGRLPLAESLAGLTYEHGGGD